MHFPSQGFFPNDVINTGLLGECMGEASPMRRDAESHRHKIYMSGSPHTSSTASAATIITNLSKNISNKSDIADSESGASDS